MKHNWMVLPALALIVVASPALAEGHRDKAGARLGGMMEKVDINGDGLISEDEFMSVHLEKFKELDINGDGNITEEEILNRHELKREQREAEMFDQMDNDGDGVISKEEMLAHHASMKDKMKDRRGHFKDKRDVPDGR